MAACASLVANVREAYAARFPGDVAIATTTREYRVVTDDAVVSAGVDAATSAEEAPSPRLGSVRIPAAGRGAPPPHV